MLPVSSVFNHSFLISMEYYTKGSIKGEVNEFLKRNQVFFFFGTYRLCLVFAEAMDIKRGIF